VGSGNEDSERVKEETEKGFSIKREKGLSKERERNYREEKERY